MGGGGGVVANREPGSYIYIYVIYIYIYTPPKFNIEPENDCF